MAGILVVKEKNMLWLSSIPAVLQKMFTQAQDTTNQLRKSDTILRLDYYFSEQYEELESTLAEHFSEPDKMIKWTLNITRKIIDNLSTVYSGQVKRTLENATENDNKIYKQILKESQFNPTMKLAQRLTKLLKTTIIRVLYIDDKIKLRILTGDLVDVVVNEDDPSRIEKILVTYEGETYKDNEYSYWTKSEYKRLNYSGAVIEHEENPYGILPFVPLFDRIPLNEFWLPGGNDLIEFQTALNTLICDFSFLLRMASHGVGSIKGMEGGNITVNPGSFVSLPKDGDLKFSNQQAEIEACIESILKLIRMVAVSHGLSPMTMQTEPVSSNRQSGISKAYDTAEMQEERAQSLDLYRGYETEIFEVVRAVYNEHTSKSKISPNANLAIDFSDPTKQTMTIEQQAQADDLKISQGVLSPVDILLRDNADLQGDRKKAMDLLLQVQRENNQLITPTV
jgi:hypothetical protein